MANVIDVSASGEPDAAVLTETASSGVFGGSFLRSRPLATYLDDVEVPRFVLRNKRSGLRIESPRDPTAGESLDSDDGSTASSDGSSDSDDGSAASNDGSADGDGNATAGNDGSASSATAAPDGTDADGADADEAGDDAKPGGDLEPASSYQALAAITDVRIVFVVGTAEGDRSVAVPISEVAAVDVEGGLLGSDLVITTTANDRYVFPCRGDLGRVADYVDLGTQAWMRAYSLLEDARDHLVAARRLRATEAFATAIVAIDAGETAVDDAVERVEAFGEGAGETLAPEAEDLRRTLASQRRETHAEHGVYAHELAREHWGNRRYERAHEAYQEATAALERAQELEATDGIADRLDRIDRELQDLADAPLSYARAMVEEAEASDDARTTAQCWEVAIERFRDVYALDWGCPAERFSGDSAAIRERILSAVDELVEHRQAGIQDRLDEAEWLRQSDDIAGAREVLEEAEVTLDRTERLVEELTHASYPELDDVRREIEADWTVLPST